MHVDDFLCAGPLANLDLLCKSMGKKYDLKKRVLSETGEQEGRYLNRVVGWMGGGECDPEHAQLLISEWGMEHCRPIDTRLTKDGQERELSNCWRRRAPGLP